MPARHVSGSEYSLPDLPLSGRGRSGVTERKKRKSKVPFHTDEGSQTSYSRQKTPSKDSASPHLHPYLWATLPIPRGWQLWLRLWHGMALAVCFG